MTDVERLLAIEEIKRLKSKYFYYLDHKDWKRWRSEVWADDATMEVPEALKEPMVGADKIVEWTAFHAADTISTHHGHMPDIEMLSADSAKATWAMEDILRMPKDKIAPHGFSYLHGFGHYHETYIRGAHGWRIKSMRLTRLHVDRS